MCGIVGYVGKKNAVDVVIGGLQWLAYRGYDSAGIAIERPDRVDGQGIFIEKAVGKLEVLQERCAHQQIPGTMGMGHTRWATHGRPSLTNAHPHRYGRVAIVHNGILENHREIRDRLIAKGNRFSTETDTEVAAHLLDSFLTDGDDAIAAIARLCDVIHGAFAFGIMIEGHDRLYFAKNASPLVVAEGDGECFFASDQAALVDHEPSYYALDDFDIGCISAKGIEVYDMSCAAKKISLSPLLAKRENVQKHGHKHFMHKEIFEQPKTIDRVLAGRIGERGIDLRGFEIDFDKVLSAERIEVVACGSSYLAGLLMRQKLEKALGIPVSVEIASEYRYRETLTDEKTLAIAISQSGETIDTLEAVKKAGSLGAMRMSVCNVLGSAIALECASSIGNLFLNAGAEISVACTKAFVAQVVALRIFIAAVERRKGLLDDQDVGSLFFGFLELKKSIEGILARDQEIRSIAQTLIKEPRMLFLGRGDFYPVALEGALKMKELSYICAEGYPAGELKHGPIATVDTGMPAVVIFGSDAQSQKTQSNMQEIKARGAKIIALSPKTPDFLRDEAEIAFSYGECLPGLEPILATIPLQLLAYHLADLNGLDVDQPRNLAKSVTVE